MNIPNTEALLLLVVFVVPGYLFQSVLSALHPRAQERPEILLLRFVGFSCINFGIWYSQFPLIDFENDPKFSFLRLVVILVVSPGVLGLFVAKVRIWGWRDWFLRELNFHPINPIPTGWDYKFSRTHLPSFVIVILKDGTNIHGWYGPNSMASSQEKDRDLYLEQLYTIDHQGKWIASVKSEGIWIQGSEVKYIEFQKGG